MVVELTDKDFDGEVGKGLTLVDFWAPWCGPCRTAAPFVDKLAVEMEGVANVVKVNVDENQGVAAKHQVMSIPTFILFKDGEVLDRTSGFTPRFVEEWTEKINAAG
ncbi:thioredoxin [bacterium]|nr:thioredoxin [bacterium]